MRARVHPQHPDVVEQIPTDDLGGQAVAVLELDVDLRRCGDLPVLALTGGRDYMRVREDEAVLRDDEPGPLSGRGRGGVRIVEVREDGQHAGSPRAVDLRRREAVAG